MPDLKELINLIKNNGSREDILVVLEELSAQKQELDVPAQEGDLTTTPFRAAVNRGNLDIVKEILQYRINLTMGDLYALEKMLLNYTGEYCGLRFALAMLKECRSKYTEDSTELAKDVASQRASLSSDAAFAGVELVYARYVMKPLHRAAQIQHIKKMEELLQSGIKVNVEDAEKCTPLHHTAMFGARKAAELLIEKEGADVMAKDNYGKVPLHYAAEHGVLDVAALLLEKGADVNAINTYKSTPLHDAVIRDRLAVVQLLLKSGAYVNAMDNNGTTPLHYASMFDTSHIAVALIEEGADVSVLDAKGCTPLRLACKYGNEKTAIVLLDKGAYIKELKRYTEVDSLLCLAVKAGSDQLVIELARAGADVNKTEKYGQSPLHVAARYDKSSELVELIKLGANVTAADDSGDTMAIIACHNLTLYDNIKKRLIAEYVELLDRNNSDAMRYLIKQSVKRKLYSDPLMSTNKGRWLEKIAIGYQLLSKELIVEAMPKGFQVGVNTFNADLFGKMLGFNVPEYPPEYVHEIQDTIIQPLIRDIEVDMNQLPDQLLSKALLKAMDTRPCDINKVRTMIQRERQNILGKNSKKIKVVADYRRFNDQNDIDAFVEYFANDFNRKLDGEPKLKSEIQSLLRPTFLLTKVFSWFPEDLSSKLYSALLSMLSREEVGVDIQKIFNDSLELYRPQTTTDPTQSSQVAKPNHVDIPINLLRKKSNKEFSREETKNSPGAREEP